MAHRKTSHASNPLFSDVTVIIIFSTDRLNRIDASSIPVPFYISDHFSLSSSFNCNSDRNFILSPHTFSMHSFSCQYLFQVVYTVYNYFIFCTFLCNHHLISLNCTLLLFRPNSTLFFWYSLLGFSIVSNLLFLAMFLQHDISDLLCTVYIFCVIPLSKLYCYNMSEVI